MFITRESAETPFGACISDQLRSWRSIEWKMNNPWFWVAVSVRIDNYTCNDALMLSMADEIAGLTVEGADSFDILEVQLVSPPYMNRSNNWKMEPLAEIVSGNLPHTRHKVHIYRCRDGTAYVDDDLQQQIPQLLEPEVIFLSHGAKHTAS